MMHTLQKNLFRWLAVLLAACLLLGAAALFAGRPAGAAAAEEKAPQRAESHLTDLGLGGYVGSVLGDNVEKWQLNALDDNPNILEAIENAAAKRTNFSSMFTDYFNSFAHYSIAQDRDGNGLIGKAVALTYTQAAGAEGFGDMDVRIDTDPSVDTDARGAEELWWYVNASQFGTQAVPVRLNFEEGDPSTAIRESWQPKAGVTVYTIADGASVRTPVQTDGNGYVQLPAGFCGWVCYPLNQDVFFNYWSSAVSNGVIDLADVHQFMFNVVANDSCIGKTLYFDAFSLVGSQLEVQEGVSAPPVGVAELSQKQFRQIWSVDNTYELNSYEGSVVAWYGEFIGKLLTGLVYNYRLSGDARLRAEIERIVSSLAAAQGSDGYLGTYVNGRFSLGTDNWDMWNHYHIAYGLYSWYECSGDEAALRIAMKAFDYLISFMAENNGGSFIPDGGLEMNLAVSHMFAILYRETGEQRYLDACMQLLQSDWNTVGSWYADAKAGRDFYQSNLHRWESLHAVQMLSVLYEVTGEKEYFDAFEHIWYSIAKTDRHNTGAFSSGEGAKGTPYLSGAGAEIETCCTVAWMALSTEYYQMSKNPLAVDELELSYFNAMLGSVLQDHKYVTYNTPMIGEKTAGYDGRKVPSQQDIDFQWNSGSPDFNCCQANAARGLGELSQWAVVSDATDLYVNYYGPSTAHTQTPAGSAIVLKQTTEYPKNGSIELKIEDLASPEAFALDLRIPSWSKQSTVRVNGEEAVSAPSGAYFRLERTWKEGDVIRIELDMGVHFWQGEENFDGYVSAYYGPILLAVDEEVSAPSTRYNTWFDAAAFEDLAVSDATADGHWLYFDVSDSSGKTVRLVDFAGCGRTVDEEPGDYATWLKIDSFDLPVMPAGREYPPVWLNMLAHGISAPEGVTVSSPRAKAGEEVSFRLAGGAEGASVTVSTDAGAVLVRENDGGYCFEMPAADVTIAVAYAKAPGGLPGRAVALIAVGGAAVAAGGVVLGLWLWKKKKGGGRGET